jgi:hypothetical protein
MEMRRNQLSSQQSFLKAAAHYSPSLRPGNASLTRPKVHHKPVSSRWDSAMKFEFSEERRAVEETARRFAFASAFEIVDDAPQFHGGVIVAREMFRQ